MSQTVPLSVLSTIDPVRRDSVAMSVVLDRPGAVVIRHDLDTAAGELHRVVIDRNGVVEDVIVELEHACISCAVREDAIPTMERLFNQARYDAIVLALPVAADSLPVTRTLAPHTSSDGRLSGLTLASVVSAVDIDGLADDLLGDERLDERGLGFSEDDDRTVGEALAAQLVHADMVRFSESEAGPIASDLMDHLRAGDSIRMSDDSPDVTQRMFIGHHNVARGERRVDPRHLPAMRRRSPSGVWTVTLQTRRPFHPDRLMDNAEHLGGGRVRTRGVFWVPTRPDSLCAWEGSGGQVSIGDLGPWGLDAPRTQLTVTGAGDEEGRIRNAFTSSLLTHEELSAGLAPWLGREDILAEWLGER